MTTPNLSVVMSGTLQRISVSTPKRQTRETESTRPELPLLHRHTVRLRLIDALEHKTKLAPVTPNVAPRAQRPVERTKRSQSPR